MFSFTSVPRSRLNLRSSTQPIVIRTRIGRRTCVKTFHRSTCEVVAAISGGKSICAFAPSRELRIVPQMLNDDAFQFAIENTRVILAPQQRIATFGSTSFHFHLVTELMDRVNEVRVREG